jgi:hypothetical protein
MGEPLPENDRPGPDDDSGWPIETDWHMLDAIEEIEARRTSLDTYEVRSPTSQMMLSGEGFNLFRDRTPQGEVIFHDWCRRHNIQMTRRADVQS